MGCHWLTGPMDPKRVGSDALDRGRAAQRMCERWALAQDAGYARMNKRLRVAVLFGGKSAEHEVSLQSARNILDAIDRDKYEPVLIGIDKRGRWCLNEASQFLLTGDTPGLTKLNAALGEVALVPGEDRHQLMPRAGGDSLGQIDVVFPVLHGPMGEDGTVQGMLKLANIPFVGPGVLGSAIGMDKDVAKRLLRDAGIPIPRFRAWTKSDSEGMTFERASKELGTPVFVKPANMGSSVGVMKANDAAGFDAAVLEAFSFDTKIVVEEAIVGRELECAVLGNDDPQASVAGEVKPTHEFYDYEAKYVDEHGAVLEIPASVGRKLQEEIQLLAIRTFRALTCEGMARVDFFLRGERELLVSEINTIPGFTRISMYPKLWEASGVTYAELIDRLIQLALERFGREQRLRTSYR